MEQYTEVDFYKAMFNLQVRATEIAINNRPVEHDGEIGYPVDDGGMQDVIDKINHLEKALAILKSNQ